MNDNINTREYWDERFGSGDWDDKRGRAHSRAYARTFIDHWHIPTGFDGTVLDFGCALGDAIPLYRAALPGARFVGVDHSGDAVAKCRARYGEVAEFAQGDHTNLPPADIIVTSHTMEHVSDDQDVVRALRERCRVLYVVVPYREHPLKKEHLRAYDEGTYDAIGPDARAVYPAFPFWTWEIFRDHRLKNLVRPLLGRRRVPVPMAIMYRFGSHD